MEHKRLSRLLLLAGWMAVLGCAFIFLLVLPLSGYGYYVHVPEVRMLYVPSLIYFWAAGVCSALALWQYMRICRRIGENRSFCAENARDLRRIAHLLFICGGMLTGYCLVACLPQVPFGPELLFCLIAAMAYAAMGLLAWALHRLIQQAVALQEENNLTI